MSRKEKDKDSSSVNHCLICYSSFKPGGGGEIGLYSGRVTSSSPSSVSKHLDVIFVLRHLLEIPKENLHTYLSTWGSPNLWICICSKCKGLVGEARKLHDELVKYSKRLKAVKQKVIQKIRRTTSGCGKGSSMGVKQLAPKLLVTLQTRNFVNTHDYGSFDDPFTRGDMEAVRVAKARRIFNSDQMDADVSEEQSIVKMEVEDLETRSNCDEEFDENDCMDFPCEPENNESLLETETKVSLQKNDTLNEMKEKDKKRTECQELECPDCRRIFRTTRQYNSHLELHRTSPYKCVISNCGRVFKSGSSLRAHRSRNHPEVIGRKKTTFQSDLSPSVHKISNYTSWFEKCETCSLSFPGVTIEFHVELQHPNLSSGAEFSQEAESSNAPLQEIIQACLSNDKFICTICVKTRHFRSRSLLKEHLDLHETSPYHCHICISVFRNIGDLRKHVSKYHPETQDPSRCSNVIVVKPQTSASTGNIQGEMVKIRRASYYCHLCKKAFKGSDFLKRHNSKYHAGDAQVSENDSCSDVPEDAQASIRVNTGRKLRRSLKYSDSIEDNDSEDNVDTCSKDNKTDKGDSDWIPQQSNHQATVSNRKVIRHRTGLKASVRCSLCNKFACQKHEIEKLFNHLEQCEGSGARKEAETEQLDEIYCPACADYKCPALNKSELINHMITCSKAYPDDKVELSTDHIMRKRIFICNICPTRVYMKLDKFLAHVLFHKKNPIKCSKCPRRFSVSGMLHEHWRACHQESFQNVQPLYRYKMDTSVPEISWWCTICNEKFIDDTSRDEHVQSIHQTELPRKIHNCRYCSKGYAWIDELKLHERTAHVALINFHACDLCSQYFLNEKILKQHTMKKHRVDLFVCEICGTGCSSQYNLSQHMELHKEKRKFACDECDQSFTAPKYLREHKFRKHVALDAEINPHVCRLCQKVFNSPHYLNTHIKTVHEKKYPFYCQVCGLGRTHQSHLDRHLATHHGIGQAKKYICPDITCKQEFKNNSGLKIHVLRHRKEPPLKCRFCSKGFYSSNHLHRHEQIHTNAESKPYQCEICSKRFPVRNYLYIHMKSHNRKV